MRANNLKFFEHKSTKMLQNATSTLLYLFRGLLQKKIQIYRTIVRVRARRAVEEPTRTLLF